MVKALSALLPLGAFGISVALAAAPAKPLVPGGTSTQESVAERLSAIRSAVSEMTAEQAGLEPGDPNIVKAWWANRGSHWGNGGWRNWRNGWANGGWHNWGNGWHNGGWHNWPNFWRNW